MNKTDLVNALATRANIGRPEATRVVDALFDASTGLIAQTLRAGQKVQLSGFGTFEARKRKGRTGRNPRTGHEIHIPASMAASFRAGKALKDALNP